MAIFDVDFPEDFLSDLLDTEFDEIAEEALKEAAPLLESSMKQSCRRVIEHSGESELVESIKSNKPKRTKTDAWIVNVGPRGYSKKKTYRSGKGKARKYRVSNALKLIWKEYGVAGRQPARPFLTSACNAVRGAVMEKMQKVYERKTGMK
ncbi:MAG: hypothetical protein HFI15_12610 [Lachnospiraceae bacterium]|nr:hypothetical protein [Lachnospiraceae bacterium]